MGQLGFRILNIALGAVCCFQAANLMNDVSADLLEPPAAVVETEAAPVVSSGPSAWSERKPILERNLFGAELFAAETAPEPEPEDVDLEETKLPLVLLGTMVAEGDPKNSKAAIKERGGRGHELVFEGHTLASHQQVRVAKIERKRIVLQNGSRREELLLEDRKAASAQENRRPPSPRLARRSRRSARPARKPAEAPTELAERLAELETATGGRSARELFQTGRWMPKFEGSEMVGMEVSEIKPGSLYEKIGLADGDVVTSLNGIKLDSTQASTRVLSQFTEAQEFEIELSDGTTKSISADELSDLLGE